MFGNKILLFESEEKSDVTTTGLVAAENAKNPLDIKKFPHTGEFMAVGDGSMALWKSYEAHRSTLFPKKEKKSDFVATSVGFSQKVDGGIPQHH